jgi:uncharacterized protein (TIGR01370 family)
MRTWDWPMLDECHKKTYEKAVYPVGIGLAVSSPTKQGGLPMLVTMRRISVGLLLWLSSYCFAASPNIAFFYGANPPWDELQAFDIVVVEPGHGNNIDPKAYSSPRTQLFAYVSVGEVQRDRPYAKDVPASWSPGANEPWNSVVIDQTQPDWPRFLVDRVIAPLWNAGYRGFFLDTLDSFQIIAKTDEERARQMRGLVNTVRAIRAQFPEAKLIFNRGFEILPQLKGEAYAVAAESLFHGWNAQAAQYVDISEKDRAWLLEQLQRVRDEYKLPVIAIDYVPPGSREMARDTARKISALGFTPWVANGGLDQLGVGAIEVMPRKILMLYEGDGNEFSLMDDRIHRLATMPLNYLGYAVEYADVNQPLPAYPLPGRFAGIVSWFNNDDVSRKPGVRDWLAKQRADGMKMAVLGSFAFPSSDPLAKSFGLSASPSRRPPQTLRMEVSDPLMGFEAQPLPDRRFFVPLRATQGAKPLLRVISENGETMDAAALTPWGGYVLAPYEFLTLPGDAGDRWIINPIEFFRRALALPLMPVPDVTTENGRRLMLVHIDGDGFVNLAETAGTPFAGEVLYRDVLQKYRIPHSVSIIQGEIAPNGLYPKDAPRLEQIARRIFALPHVEIASHTYSHPFRWASAAGQADPESYHLNIPGYNFDLRAEIPGSIDYINSRLAPPGKRVRMVFWSGDTNPGSEALRLGYDAGVLNFNGGDTTITRRNRTLSRVAPIGLQKGGYFQIYAPNQNENVYTNLWTGPFYGFERVIETFELTETPLRLKPIDIYYHVYSASKRASLNALDRVYQWALKQNVMNVYASEYAQKVLDFNRMVVARGADGWIVRGGGALRELRIPNALGVPDVASSRAVAGYQPRGDQVYVHLTDGDALLQTAPQVPTQPYLVEANGRITNWSQERSNMQFSLQAYVPLRFALANVSGCRVEGDGRPLTGVVQGGITRYELKQNGIERISISCAS